MAVIPRGPRDIPRGAIQPTNRQRRPSLPNTLPASTTCLHSPQLWCTSSQSSMPDQSKQRIVIISVDGSHHSKQAVAWAKTHVVQPSDNVHLVTAVHPKTDPAHSLGLYLRVPLAMAPGNILKAPNMHAERAEWEKDEAARVACATDMLREYSQQLCTEATITLRVLTDDESPGAALVKYADTIKADLAVVGSRGMGGIHRKIASLIGLGSVSDHLVCLIPNCLVH
mmetsp:Transcript_37745/g.72326  ORF Transcript_37745/g.72326 Transcript_37745/m.72326 type:complete len:226 (+) Transcript_37745:103-780(+)